MKGRFSTAVLRATLAATVLLAGCASTPDPLEPMNRGTFWFNEKVDRFVLEPVATGWDFVIPEVAQTGLRNFFENLSIPVIFVNDLLQLKPLDSGEDLARLAINSTLGIGGFLDVASKIGIDENDEDFGQTLGSYGVPPGPYIVLPLLGASSVRGVFGWVGDAAATPTGYLLSTKVNGALRGLQIINLRAFYLEEVRQSRADSLDYYVFVRNAYRENRQHRVNDQDPDAGDADEDLYYLNEGEEESEADDHEDE